MMRPTICALSTIALLAGAGCATRPVRAAEKAAASVLVSDEQEKELGLQLHKELEKEGMKYVQDPAVVNYVTEIARPIIQRAKKDRNQSFSIYVVDKPSEVNAFATPGGNLYVMTGLILAAKNEAELAGVLAHESGHVTNRHAARNMVGQLGLETVASLALGKNPSMMKQLAAQVVATGGMLHHSRAQETEADESGAIYATAAGYDPQGLISFFQTLQKQEGKTPKILTFLSTHPATSDRISHLQSYIADKKLHGGSLNTLNQLSSIQQRLGGSTTAGAGK
jgi:beta-barrel assembly-enhancing protease